ncbi:MAG: hypothetical protein JWM16_3386, partial [Verrucomicrobiales bacterium]|nr:hypothetical protein [Verrucomicrobiales bacterium]
SRGTRRLNAKAAEKGLQHYTITTGPSLFEVMISLKPVVDEKKVLNDCAERMVDWIPQQLEHLGIFGCVDPDDDCFIELETNQLMLAPIRIMSNVWPYSYPELGRRFDALHPILFGCITPCQGLSSALDKDAHLIKSKVFSNFAAVRISEDCDLEEAKRRASKWLISSQRLKA